MSVEGQPRKSPSMPLCQLRLGADTSEPALRQPSAHPLRVGCTLAWRARPLRTSQQNRQRLGSRGKLAASASLDDPRNPKQVWLSPNARDEPPSDPRGIIRIARELYLKDSVLRDGAMEQKRQAEDHNKRGREP